MKIGVCFVWKLNLVKQHLSNQLMLNDAILRNPVSQKGSMSLHLRLSKLSLIVRRFKMGLTDSGGWLDGALPMPQIQASFLHPFLLSPPYEKGEHNSGEFFAVCQALLVANLLPPTRVIGILALSITICPKNYEEAFLLAVWWLFAQKPFEAPNRPKPP